MFWNREMETLSGKALEDLQVRRLRWTIKQAENVPFFKRLLKEKGVFAEDIKKTSDVSKLPFTTKKDLQGGYPFGFMAVPKKEIAR